MKLAFSIAIRFLKSSKGQTALIVIGIMIGVAVQIFIGSLIDGLQVSLVDRTIGSSSHITITSSNNENFFENNQELIEDLKEDERLSAVSNAFDATGFIIEDEESSPVLMRGFEFKDANEIYNFPEVLIEGNLPEEENEIIIGQNLAEESDYQIGDIIEFITPTGDLEDLSVTGVFDLGVASLNESWLITELGTAQTIFEEEGNVSAIETQVTEIFDADIVADDIEAQIDDLGLTTSNWKDENEQLLSGLTGQSISSYMIQVFVLIAVLLGIASVLAISAVQKSKQLGILKAMGIQDRTAGQIFLLQGLVLGTIGSIIGTGLGIGLMYGFSTFVKNADGTALVPFYVNPKFVIGSAVIAIIASTIAAFIPAKNSARLNPMEVIKNG